MSASEKVWKCALADGDQIGNVFRAYFFESMRRICLFCWLILISGLSGAPVISEFMASNNAGLQDEDGDFSDWIEIHNPDSTPIDLTGWHLTDNASNPAKWRFPQTVIPAGGYRLVYASNKNRAISGQPLHTNFALAAGGEFLGLVAADGVTVVSSYSPTYPAQSADVSYGIPSAVETHVIVPENAVGRWIVPTSAGNPDATWRNVGFNHSSWASATMGIGYDRNVSGVNYLTEIGSGGNTEVQMYNIIQSCYLRVPFTLNNPTLVQTLKLRVRYDDGFAAYINGQPMLSSGVVLKRNCPTNLVWNSGATTTHDDPDAIVPEDIDVTSSIPLLLAGGNVISFQVLNRSSSSSDLLFKPELVAELVDPNASLAPGFFGASTPGSRNGGPETLVIPQQVAFSRAEGTFSANFNLTLTGALPGQIIRYTTNGSQPTISSSIYSSPIPISGSTQVRAKVFDQTTGASGAVTGVGYEKLGTSLTSYATTGAAFRSSLPVMVLNNQGIGEIPNDNVYRDVRMHLLDRDSSGYSTISATPVLSSLTGVKLRGSSSAGFDKKSYSLELRRETLDSRALEILGMPAGSDWALISCDDFDPSFMRNAWVYEAFRRTGQWSPRTRFIELFFNQDGNNLDYTDYRGVYVLCESIRDHPSRADITSIEAADISQPALSGGYVLKVDRYDSDEFNWHTSRSLPPSTTSGNALVIHRPKNTDLAPEQSSYLVNFFQTFEDTLFNEAAGGFATRNYRNHIDSRSWVDHNLFNCFAKNVDALRLSSYYFKDRGRPIHGGPLWDFDRSANSTDDRDNDFNTWVGTGDGTNYFTFAWWQPLFQDIEFRQLYVDRWQGFRTGVLSTTGIYSILDTYLTEFRTADADHPGKRDYARWYGSATAKNLPAEVTALKTWLANRAAWIDSQFVRPPVLQTPPGLLNPGQTVSLGIPSGTTVYYRTDGLDPRAEGGGVRSGSLVYNGTPVALATTTVLTARAWKSGSFAIPATNWSGLVSPLYLVNEAYATAANLRVSAIHYHPLAPDAAESAVLADVSESDFEWIEFMNAGNAPINLEGVSLDQDKPVSSLVLPAFTLAPGGRGVVVKRRAAFLLRHPSAGGSVIAEWSGDRSLDNNGESILARDKSGGLIASFGYDDSNGWPSRADGDGGALEYTGADQTTLSYETASNWRTSAAIHGTPGVAGTGPRLRVFINEVLASSVIPQTDAIELHNPGSSPVDVGGWFLSNTPAALTVSDYRRFRIPDGTVLLPGGFKVFTEVDFNPNGIWNPSPGAPGDGEFSMDGFRGGRIWLVSADPASQRLDGFEDHFDFTPALAGVAQGRWPDASESIRPLSVGTLFNPASSAVPSPGLGAPNAGPRLGELQVSEIMYHPQLGEEEYLEIVNVSALPLSLDQWTLRGDVEFDFMSAMEMAPGESALMVSFDPTSDPVRDAAFRSSYQVPAGVRLFGPWSSMDTMGDGSGTVRLRRKVPAPPDEPLYVGRMMEDEVMYSALAPWPVGASGTGLSISRLGARRDGNDPTSWIVRETSSGSESGGWQGWLREHFPVYGPGSAAMDDHDLDGLPNQLEYRMGTDPKSAGPLPWQPMLVLSGEEVEFIMEYRVRRDRNEFPLLPQQSSDLLNWSEAADDRHFADDGWFEIRRVHLPTTQAGGYLRLMSPIDD